jgi:DNA replication protein DnaC
MINEMLYQEENGWISQMDPARLRASGLPAEAFSRHHLHQLKPRADVEGLESAVRAIKAVVDGELTKPVMFYGTAGLGKTHLAHAAAIMLLARGKTVRFCPVPGLLDELRRGYQVSEMKPDQQGTERTYEMIMNWLGRVHLLILDDIGAAKVTDWSLEKLDQIVDMRYSNDKPVLITSNRIDFSERIVDRCKEGALIRIKGASYRGTIPLTQI